MEKPRILKEKSDTELKVKEIDAFSEALTELFFIENPRLKISATESAQALKEFVNLHKADDVWVHYPWRDLLVRCLKEDLYFKLRTSRNQDIITEMTVVFEVR